MKINTEKQKIEKLKQAYQASVTYLMLNGYSKLEAQKQIKKDHMPCVLQDCLICKSME